MSVVLRRTVVGSGGGLALILLFVRVKWRFPVNCCPCCSRNCDAEHQGKRPFDLPKDDTTLVTILSFLYDTTKSTHSIH